MEVRLVLISHTNVGKTSLARTLLRRDVGEIVDAAHTTLENQRHVLVEQNDDRLVLWDTPGFGNSARLRDRLQQRERPLGWFLGQVWDRFTDRSLWCAQQAMRAVRDEGDLVLYLVNASEDPEFATYIDSELEILEWLEVPVLVLLNQLPPQGRPEARTALEASWRRALDRPSVKAVLALDAFERCWIDESRLLLTAAETLGRENATERAEALGRLLPIWQQGQLERFRASIDAIARALARVTTDREPLGRGQSNRIGRAAALKRLARRLETTVAELESTLVRLEELEGASAQRVEAALTATRDHGDRPSPGSGAAGGALAGAGAGALLDLLFAGLTFGVFTTLGASLSAAAGFSWCWQAVDRRTLGWSAAFIEDLTVELAARYLAVTHHGRARGRFDGSALDSWREPGGEMAVGAETTSLKRLTNLIEDTEAGSETAMPVAAPLVRDVLVRALLTDYPTARWILGDTAAEMPGGLSQPAGLCPLRSG
ncbi:MAG: GTPase domain-containing protein [Gammaproteobacteria bacterium]|nr:GTPase domain-containing protein [Gammaproteobacteria bacterium]